MIGSRNRPIFSTTPISRLTCASDGSRWYGVGSTAGDRQRHDQQRLAAERIAVAAEHGAAVVLDLRRQRVERAALDRLRFRRRQPDGARRDFLPANRLLLRHRRI